MNRRKIISTCFGAALLFFTGYASDSPPQTPEKEIIIAVESGYLLYLPKQYEEDKKPWPLILFLHGRGERGNDLTLLKPHLPPMIEDEREDFPFILVAPQLPITELWWSTDVLNALLDDVVSKYRVDEDRIYVTGYSMGGYGTWQLAFEYPDRFAAIAPICGGGDPSKACKIKHIAAWVIHGAKDDVVPFKESEDMVNALKECGGDVKFVVFPELGHGGWSETYGKQELFIGFWNIVSKTAIKTTDSSSFCFNHE